MRSVLFPAVLALSFSPAALRAQQCPDGSPQPCRSAAAHAPAPNSIAVFPFSSRSPDTTDAYLAEGMTDEVGSQLTKLSRLQVKAHGLVAAAWEKNRDLAVAARTLGVAWFLDGSVRRGSGQLLINVALVRVTTGEEVWQKRFQRRDADLFGTQAEVAESVAVVVTGRLTASERAVLGKRLTRSDSAWRLYMLGNALLGRRSENEVRSALAAFQEAARIDPGFVAAWARISFARSIQWSWGGWRLDVPRDSALALARTTAARALALDSSSAEAWMAAGAAATFSDDLGFAYRALRRSVGLDSLSPETWHFFGTLYGFNGSWSLGLPMSAEPLLKRALALDPTLRGTWNWLAGVYRAEGHLALAEAALDTALSLGPLAGAFYERSDVRFLRGNGAEAIADLEAATAIDSYPRTAVRDGYKVLLGDSAPARAILVVLRAQADSGRPSTALARFAMALGSRDEALSVLERLRNTPSGAEPRCAPSVPCSPSLSTWRLLHDPLFAPLHGDPRFEKLWKETMPKVPWLPANEQGR